MCGGCSSGEGERAVDLDLESGSSSRAVRLVWPPAGILPPATRHRDDRRRRLLERGSGAASPRRGRAAGHLLLVRPRSTVAAILAPAIPATTIRLNDRTRGAAAQLSVLHANAGAASGANARERALAAENEELKAALGEAHVELRVWKKSAEGRSGPTRSSR